MSSQILPQYSCIDRTLKQYHSLFDAPEAHGLLCGLLCVLPKLRIEVWLKQLDILGNCQDEQQVIIQLYESTCFQFQDITFDFHPLLPNDEQHINIRAKAIGRWCQGFLTGAGSSERNNTQLTSQFNEVIKDMSKIAGIDHFSDAPCEGDEKSYAELYEYIRIATLNLYNELNAVYLAQEEEQAFTVH